MSMSEQQFYTILTLPFTGLIFILITAAKKKRAGPVCPGLQEEKLHRNQMNGLTYLLASIKLIYYAISILQCKILIHGKGFQYCHRTDIDNIVFF